MPGENKSKKIYSDKINLKGFTEVGKLLPKC